jgi:nucleotide-binding universal stress UspA family protein
MELIQRILCPVDFSEVSHRTFEYAEKLARSAHAELILAHAFEMPAAYTVAGQSLPADPAEGARLREYKPSSPLLKIDHVLHAGPPGEVICWLAENRDCDLIVMGSHGKRALTRLLLGSVAEFVLRHARCPVLVLPHRRQQEGKLKEPYVVQSLPSGVI